MILVGMLSFMLGSFFGTLLVACVTAGRRADERAERLWELRRAALRYGAHMPPPERRGKERDHVDR